MQSTAGSVCGRQAFTAGRPATRQQRQRSAHVVSAKAKDQVSGCCCPIDRNRASMAGWALQLTAAPAARSRRQCCAGALWLQGSSVPGLPPQLQPPGFKYDGAMQRWVRDDRFAGRGLEKIQPLRCSCAALHKHTSLVRTTPRAYLLSPSFPPAYPSLQRHTVHSVAGDVGLPEQEGAEAD